MRIGELLLERGALSHGEIERALDAQTRDGGRLCSILISDGALDFDIGARALADRHGVPCALSKHLANRDPALAALLPAELGRSACALPLGRTGTGTLIVAVRDPDHGLLATLCAAAGEDILMVVAPAVRLEQLVAAAYGAGDDDFDVDFDSAVALETRTPLPPPTPTDLDMLDADSIRLGLTALDDERVFKDPTQSGMFSLPGILPPPPLTVLAAGTQPRPTTLAETRQALQTAASRDAATALAMAFLCNRWRSAIVFAVRHATALGYRAHAAQVTGDISRLAVPLSLPSTIERAVTSKQPTASAPESPAQDQLARALGNPAVIAAAPVLVAGQVVAVIAAGDAVAGAGDGELGALAASLGEAYQRTRSR